MKKILFLSLLISATSFAKVSNGQKFDAWTAECTKGICEVNQKFSTPKGELIAIASIAKPKETKGRAVMSFLLPLGVNLRQGVGIAVDTKQISRSLFDFCFPAGCVVMLPLEGQVLQKIRAGNKMQVGAFVGDKQQTVEFSLKGVSKAIDSL